MTIVEEIHGRKPRTPNSKRKEPVHAATTTPTTNPSRRVFVDVPPKEITPSAFNVAHREPDDNLVRSINRFDVLEPILVRPIPATLVTEANGAQSTAHYELIFGERRWRGAGRLGKPTIIAEVRQLTDEEAIDLIAEENLQRADLTPLQEAQVFALYARRGLDAPAIAARVSKSEKFITQRLKLLELNDDERQALADARILLGTAIQLACLPATVVGPARAEALKLCLSPDGVKSVRETRAALTRRFYLRMADSTFDTADGTLVAQAGPCTTCPKRTSAQLALSIEGLDEEDRCGDPDCWHAKVEADWSRRRTTAEKLGIKILDTKAPKKADQDEAQRALFNRTFFKLDDECDVLEVVDTAEEIVRLECKLGELKLGDPEPARVEQIEAKLVELEERRGPTWRQVLDELAQVPFLVSQAVPHMPTAILREDTYSGAKVHELLDPETAFSILRGAREQLAPMGLRVAKQYEEQLAGEPPEATDDVAQRDREMRDAVKLEARTTELFHARLRKALVEGAEKTRPRPGIAYWRAAVLGVIHAAIYKAEPRRILALLGARGWKKSTTELDSIIEEKAGHMTEMQLRGLLFDLIAIDDVAAVTMAKELGIDDKALRKEAARAAKSEAKGAGKGKPAPTPGTCEKCECTEDNACVDPKDGLPCSWVTDTLCSACAGTRVPRRSSTRGRVVELDEPKPAKKASKRQTASAEAT